MLSVLCSTLYLIVIVHFSVWVEERPSIFRNIYKSVIFVRHRIDEGPLESDKYSINQYVYCST